MCVSTTAIPQHLSAPKLSSANYQAILTRSLLGAAYAEIQRDTIAVSDFQS
jgi:hypothetical protein